MRLWDLIVIAIYFLGITLFGIHFSKRNKNTEDYFLGGRSFPGWAIGLSMVGTSISSVSFLAWPGDTFKTTWMRTIIFWYMPIATLIAAKLFIPFYRRSKVTTAYEFLEGRWGPFARYYASSLYYPLQLIRISTVLYLLAQLMHVIIGWPMLICVLIGGIVVSVYTIAGGIEAVVWTDVVQTIILMLGGLMILGVIAAEVPGGIGEIIRLGLADHKLSFGQMMPDGTVAAPNWSLDFGQKTLTVLFIMALIDGISYMCADQNLVQRYCAARSTKEAKKALWVTCCTSIPVWVYFCFLGTAMYVFFKHFPTEQAANILNGTNGAKAEEILPYFVTNYLPAGLSGLVVASCLAAAMSSLDSSINSISTVFVNDLYRRRIKPGQDDSHYLKIAHRAALAASIIMVTGASLLVITPTNTLQDTMYTIRPFISSGFTLVFIMGLFTRIGDTRSLIAGLCMLFAFKFYFLFGTLGWIPEAARINIDNYYVGICGEAVGMLTVVVAAWLLPKKERDLTGYTLRT